jgi:hypothetical protein
MPSAEQFPSCTENFLEYFTPTKYFYHKSTIFFKYLLLFQKKFITLQPVCMLRTDLCVLNGLIFNGEPWFSGIKISSEC